MKSQDYVATEVADIIHAAQEGRTPRIPKGVKLYRRRAGAGELFDRGRVSIKSKGRTGAAIRRALVAQLAGRDLLLPCKK